MSSPAQHVNFEVDVQGVRPGEGPAALQRRRRQVLRHQGVRAGKNMYDPWQVTLTNVQQSMDYYLTGGDAESRHYHLEVLPAPTVDCDLASTSISPSTPRSRPARTSRGRASRRSKAPKVTVHAQTNMPARLATLNIARPSIRPPMTVCSKDDPTQLTGSSRSRSRGPTRSTSGPPATRSIRTRSITTSSRSPIGPRPRGSSSPTSRSSRSRPTSRSTW